MEFLEHEKELRRLQLLKEVSIADAKEKAFKRLLHEEQTLSQGYMRPEFSEERHTKVNPSFQADRRLHKYSNINTNNSGIHDEHVHVPSHEQHIARPFEYHDHNKSEIALHSGPHVDARPLTLGAKQSTHTGEPIMNTLKQLVEVQTRQAELSAWLTKQNITNHLPVKEPPTFNGDVFDYPSFTAAFESIISVLMY